MKSVDFLKKHNVNIEKCMELFGDMSIYNSTMQDFLDGIDEKRKNLDNAKKTENWANYGIFAHSIKSDARYLGFSDFAQIFLEHEMAGKSSDQKFIEKDYDNLNKTVDEMIKIVKEYLSGEETEKIEEKIISSSDSYLLVADDSPLITNFVTKALPDKKILVAKDGNEVINIIKEKKYNINCLLLDLNMPNLDGFGVLDYFKENNLFSDIPVSVITGDDSMDMVSRAFTYGIIDVVNKPFGIEVLKDVIEKTSK